MQGEICAARGQPQRDGPAQAGGTAGDKRHPAGKRKVGHAKIIYQMASVNVAKHSGLFAKTAWIRFRPEGSAI